MFQIVRLGEGNKVAYDITGKRYFIPEGMRTNIKVGDYCTAITEEFSSRTNDKGELEACEPWQRVSVGFHHSDRKEFLKLSSGAEILAAESKLVVAAEMQNIAKEYNLTPEQLKAVW